MQNLKLKTLLEVSGRVPGGQGQHHVLGPVEGSQQERDVLIGVGEVFSLVGVGQDHVSIEPGRLPTGPGQEEGVGALTVIGEVFNQNILLIQSVRDTTNVVVNVPECADFH